MPSGSKNLKLLVGFFFSSQLFFFLLFLRGLKKIWSFNKYKILMKRKDCQHTWHAPASRRRLHHSSGVCSGIQWSKVTFKYGIRNTATSSMWWCDASVCRSSGWVPMVFLLLLPLFSLFSLSKYGVSYHVFCISNLVLILLIIICFVSYFD